MFFATIDKHKTIKIDEFVIWRERERAGARRQWSIHKNLWKKTESYPNVWDLFFAAFCASFHSVAIWRSSSQSQYFGSRSIHPINEREIHFKVKVILNFVSPFIRLCRVNCVINKFYEVSRAQTKRDESENKILCPTRQLTEGNGWNKASNSVPRFFVPSNNGKKAKNFCNLATINKEKRFW